jgi:hypothetical protein
MDQLEMLFRITRDEKMIIYNESETMGNAVMIIFQGPILAVV